MRWVTILDGVIFVLFTVLFYVDYFPEGTVAQAMPVGFSLLLLLALLIGRSYLEKPFNRLQDQIASLLYIIFLMGLFTLLGGKAQYGFGFDGYTFWIFAVICLINLFKDWKKIKQGKLETNE